MEEALFLGLQNGEPNNAKLCIQDTIPRRSSITDKPLISQSLISLSGLSRLGSQESNMSVDDQLMARLFDLVPSLDSDIGKSSRSAFYVDHPQSSSIGEPVQLLQHASSDSNLHISDNITHKPENQSERLIDQIPMGTTSCEELSMFFQAQARNIISDTYSKRREKEHPSRARTVSPNFADGIENVLNVVATDMSKNIPFNLHNAVERISSSIHLPVSMTGRLGGNSTVTNTFSTNSQENQPGIKHTNVSFAVPAAEKSLEANDTISAFSHLNNRNRIYPTQAHRENGDNLPDESSRCALQLDTEANTGNVTDKLIDENQYDQDTDWPPDECDSNSRPDIFKKRQKPNKEPKRRHSAVPRELLLSSVPSNEDFLRTRVLLTSASNSPASESSSLLNLENSHSTCASCLGSPFPEVSLPRVARQCCCVPPCLSDGPCEALQKPYAEAIVQVIVALVEAHKHDCQNDDNMTQQSFLNVSITEQMMHLVSAVLVPLLNDLIEQFITKHLNDLSIAGYLSAARLLLLETSLAQIDTSDLTGKKRLSKDQTVHNIPNNLQYDDISRFSSDSIFDEIDYCSGNTNRDDSPTDIGNTAYLNSAKQDCASGESLPLYPGTVAKSTIAAKEFSIFSPSATSRKQSCCTTEGATDQNASTILLDNKLYDAGNYIHNTTTNADTCDIISYKMRAKKDMKHASGKSASISEQIKTNSPSRKISQRFGFSDSSKSTKNTLHSLQAKTSRSSITPASPQNAARPTAHLEGVKNILTAKNTPPALDDTSASAAKVFDELRDVLLKTLPGKNDSYTSFRSLALVRPCLKFFHL